VSAEAKESGGKAPLSSKEVDALKDSPQLAPFMRMRAAGVPMLAIKQKMLMENIEQR